MPQGVKAAYGDLEEFGTNILASTAKGCASMTAPSPPTRPIVGGQERRKPQGLPGNAAAYGGS
jgi:hypothetical protein